MTAQWGCGQRGGVDNKQPTRRRAPATVAEVNSYRTPGRYSVGDGLLLVVNPSGSRSWLARVRDPSGKRRDIGLGRFPEVTLKEARDRAAEHRKVVRDGLDPVVEKRKAANTIPTFAEAAQRVYDERKSGFKNDKHSAQWLSTLKDYAYPMLGSRPIDKVTGPLIVQAVKPIWLAKPETARRTLQRIGVVISWATAHGYREHEASMKAIKMGLPPQPKGVKHFAAVPYADAPAVFAKLRAEPETIARLALQFTILTCVRSGEARGARWDEVDLEARTWTVPADRMKMKTEHVVPLNDSATAMLRQLHASRSSSLIFPGLQRRTSKPGGDKPLSDVAVTKALQLVAPDATVHGWRSTFRDWGAEETNVASEVLEKALAHQISSAVERAYRRGDLLEKRRQLMQAWDSFLQNRSATIVPIRGAA